MANMTTSLTQRSDAADTREWAAPTHTLAVPFLVRQKRSTPKTLIGRAVDTISVLRGGVDTVGAALNSPLTASLTVNRQANMAATDSAAALALLREIVASDNFTALWNSQAYVAGG